MAGDILAFEKLYYLYEKQLNYHAYRLTKSRFIAEEIIQEVFIQVWENHRNIKPHMSFQAYLYRLVRNRAFNYLRDSVQHEDLSEGLWQDVLQSRNKTDDKLISKDYEKLICKIIEGLPTRKRTIYMLSRYEGKSKAEIARQLGITPKTVENHLWKTIQIIKIQLNPHFNITWLILFVILFF